VNRTYTNLFAVLAAIIAFIALTPYFWREDIIFKLGSTEEFSRFGSYAGGILTPIFSFFSILILIKTLNETKRANLQQSSVFTIEILNGEIKEKIEKIEKLLDKEFKYIVKSNSYTEYGPRGIENFISFKIIREGKSKYLRNLNNPGQLEKMVRGAFHSKGENEAREIIKNIRTHLENYRVCVSEIIRLEASPIIKVRFLTEFIECMNRIRSFEIVTAIEMQEANISFEDIRIALAERICTKKMCNNDSYFTQNDVKISRIHMV